VPGGDHDREERPGRRRVRRGGGLFWLLFLGLLGVGGAAFGGRYFGLLREKLEKLKASATEPAPSKGVEPAPAPSAPPAPEGEKAAAPAPEAEPAAKAGGEGE